jgi:hypothetical protein
VGEELDVDADDRFGEVAGGVEAMITQVHAELIHALGAEAAMAFIAGRKFRTLGLFVGVYLGMNFQSNHCNLPDDPGANTMPISGTRNC